jgi:hypothetical protein
MGLQQRKTSSLTENLRDPYPEFAFISYSRYDTLYVNALDDTVRGRGFRTWVDRDHSIADRQPGSSESDFYMLN